MAGTLSNQQVEVLSWLEQCFWTHNKLPTAEAVAEKLDVSVSTIRRYYKDETFLAAAAARGIDLEPGKSADLLSPQQLMLANMLLNMHDKSSVREKLEKINITSQQYHAWLRNETFQQYLATRGEALFKSSDHEAYMSLIDAVRAGDGNMLKLYFEMRGIYNPRVQVDINIDMVLTRVVEIISTHVKDPAILERIAVDLEALDTGNSGGAPAMPVLPAPPVVREHSGFVL